MACSPRKKSLRRKPSLSPDPMNPQGRKQTKLVGLGRIRRPRMKRNFFFFLLGKWMYQEIEFQEKFVLVEIFSDMAEDPKRYNLTGLEVEILQRDLIKEINAKEARPRSDILLRMSPLLRRLLPDAHTYFGWKGKEKILFPEVSEIRFKSILVPKAPPERYIGVGYKDKGSRSANPVEKWARLEADRHYWTTRKVVEETTFHYTDPEKILINEKALLGLEVILS